MSKGKVLIAAPVHEVLTTGLKQAGYELVISEQITQAKAFELIGACVGVITSTRLQLNKELLDAATRLEWIGRMGSGMEVIDVAYASRKGIRCVGSPEGNCNAVAEHAIGMLLSVTKRIAWSFGEVKDGKWLRDENRGMELEGKNIGIIGFGHVGRSLAKKLSSFDMRILVYDKYQRGDMPPYVLSCENLDQIYAEADIISFHVPLQPDTFHYFNEDFLGRMARPFILINTSRGNVVDTQVLYEGLRTKKVIAACLDVIEGEPLKMMNEYQRELLNRMAEFPQVLITPHIAGYSQEALYKMSRVLLDKIVIIR